FSCSRCHHRALPSFPTRRSSDLAAVRAGERSHNVSPIQDVQLIPLGLFTKWDAGSKRSPVAEAHARSALQCDREISAGVALKSEDRKSTRLNSSHVKISYAVFCL